MFRTKSNKSSGSRHGSSGKRRSSDGGCDSEELSTGLTLDESTAVSVPLNSENESISSSSSKDYSADIQPLTFKVNMTREEAEARRAFHQFPDTLSKVKEKLLKGNNRSNDSILRHFLRSIDREQFENYLKEPRHIKVLKRGKHLKQFRRLFLAQELKAYDVDDHQAGKPKIPLLSSESSPRAIWVTKFSVDGKYMATGSKDGTIWIWKVIGSPLERWELDFSQESHKQFKAKTMMVKQQLLASSPNASIRNESKFNSPTERLEPKVATMNLYAPVFHPHPCKKFKEHTADILDMDWSKNNFLATSSMDKTVRLWHPERLSSLKTFCHPDFATCVLFHPSDDRFLITGCLDHKCRLWSILENEVTFEFDCQDLVTSLTVSPGDGEFTIVGTFNGYINVLATRGLDFVSSFHITDRDTQVENATPEPPAPGSKSHHGPRISCLQCFKPIGEDSFRLVVTSNDSRIRVFNLKTKKCLEILRGFESGTSQHKAQLSFYRNQPLVVCGSDDHWVYSWKLNSPNSGESSKDSSKVKRAGSLRGFISNSLHHNGESKSRQHHGSLHLRNLLPHPHGGSSDQPVKNNYFLSFHAHHAPVTTATIAPPETSKTLSLSNDLICDLSLEFFTESDTLDILGRKRADSSDSDKDSIDNDNVDDLSIGSGMTHENSPDGVTKPSVVDAIGTIMVTTDTKGLIRVFRADMPSNIRRKMLEKLHEFSNEKLNSSDSLSTLNQGSFISNASTGRLHSNSFIGLNRANGTLGAEDFTNRHLKASSVFKNSLFNHSNGSLSSCKSPRCSLSSVTPEDGNDRKFSSGNSGTVPALRCEVCNGTKFNTMSNSSSATSDAGYYCADCGTMLNNFR